jgi:hypothetical protein
MSTKLMLTTLKMTKLMLTTLKMTKLGDCGDIASKFN